MNQAVISRLEIKKRVSCLDNSKMIELMKKTVKFNLLNVKFSIDKLLVYDIITLVKTLKRKSRK